MIELKESQDVYFSNFALLEKKLAVKEPSWLGPIRKAAIDRFAELGFPTTRKEEWRFTSVAPIAGTPFQPAPSVASEQVADELKRLPFAHLDCSRLVFVNGRYAPALSSTEGLPQGIKAGSLASGLAEPRQSLEEHLARHANFQDHAFVALNTAFIEDGAFIEVPKGLVLEKPLVFLFISTAAGRPAVSHPRNLILLGPQSQVTLIEAHLGLEKEVYFTNAVTELVVGEGAIADYYKLEDESGPAFHMATLQVHQDRSSNVSTHAISLGGALVRQEVNVVLDGAGAECLLSGLYMADRQQHIDNYTTIDHVKPHCNSRELYKGILDGKSSAVFHGRIVVRKGAQKTDAKQSNKNLLLSDGAVLNTKPQLEIYADDVKCTHGATIGQIDPDAIFYLRSRGIGRQEARSMLTYAFANEMISRIKSEPLRARLTEALFARLGNGQSAKEA